ncbi:MAG TPA: hypothetical protein VGN79_01880 [Devosia sp.]|jgi:hypothetical protein|nr:hypothetical protein [Devosia sp.]
MDTLSELPPFALVVFGATLAVIFAVRHLSILQGQKSAPTADKEGGGGRILGAVINSKKADELIAAVGRLGTRLAENTRALDANTTAVSSAEREIDEARTDIRELNREIAKSGK